METLKFHVERIFTMRVVVYGIFFAAIVLFIVTAVMVYVTAYTHRTLITSSETTPFFSSTIFDPVFELNERKAAIPELSVSESRFE